MKLDDRQLTVLIEDSQDMQSDALRGLDSNLSDLRDLRADRRGQTAEPEEVDAFLASRRDGVELGSASPAPACLRAGWSVVASPPPSSPRSPSPSSPTTRST